MGVSIPVLVTKLSKVITSHPLLLGGQRRLGDGPSAQLELVPWSGSP